MLFKPEYANNDGKQTQDQETLLSVLADQVRCNNVGTRFPAPEGLILGFGTVDSIEILKRPTLQQHWLRIYGHRPSGEEHVGDYILKDKDVTQDWAVMVMLRLVNGLWKGGNVRFDGELVHVQTYDVHPIGVDAGLVEMVNDTSTIRKLKRDFTRVPVNLGTDKEKLPKLGASTVGYLVSSYLLGVADANRDNLLITLDGNLFRVNFKYLFAQSPSLDAPGVWLPKAVTMAFGDQRSAVRRISLEAFRMAVSVFGVSPPADKNALLLWARLKLLSMESENVAAIFDFIEKLTPEDFKRALSSADAPWNEKMKSVTHDRMYLRIQNQLQSVTKVQPVDPSVLRRVLAKNDDIAVTEAMAGVGQSLQVTLVSGNSTEVIKYIMSAMTMTRATTIQIKVKGFRLLGVLAERNDPNVRRQIHENGGVKAVIQFMQANLSNVAVQRSGCCAIAGLARDVDVPRKTQMIRSGSVETLVQAMDHHVDDVVLQEGACLSLSRLSEVCDDTEGATAVLEAGGIRVVTRAMQNYGDNVELQKAGCFALAHLVMRPFLVGTPADAGWKSPNSSIGLARSGTSSPMMQPSSGTSTPMISLRSPREAWTNDSNGSSLTAGSREGKGCSPKDRKRSGASTMNTLTSPRELTCTFSKSPRFPNSPTSPRSACSRSTGKNSASPSLSPRKTTGSNSPKKHAAVGWRSWMARHVKELELAASGICSAGGLDAVVLAMGQHQESVEIQRGGFHLLENFITKDWAKKAKAVCDAGGVNVIVGAMLHHSHEQEIRRAGCHMLSYLVKTSVCCCIVDLGGVDAVVFAMEKELHSAVLQQHGCQIFNDLLQGPPDRDLHFKPPLSTVCKSEAIHAVIKGMIHNVDDPKLQLQGCNTLSCFAHSSPKSRVAVLEAGGFGAVMQAMARHQEDPAVQVAACQVLKHIANPHNSEDKNAAYRLLPDFTDVMQAMEENQCDPDVQRCTFHALARIAELPDGCGEGFSFHQRRSVSAIVQQMEKHPSDRDFQRDACCALVQLAKENPSGTRPAILQTRTLGAIVRAMILHPGDQSIQRYACCVLLHLSEEPVVSKNVRCLAGGIDAIVRAMRRHCSDAVLQQDGCHLLTNLSETYANKTIIAWAGAREVAMRAMEVHKNDQVLHEAAHRLLESLKDFDNENSNQVIAGGDKTNRRSRTKTS